MSRKGKHGLSSLDQSIIEILSNEHPQTVKQLVRLVQLKNGIPEQRILERISLLRDQGRIVLEEQLSLSFSFKDYVLSAHSYWYLLILTFAVTTTIVICAGDELERVPIIGGVFVYARFLFGTVFVLFLPGYSFIKALFPTKEIDNVERFALSIGMSLAIVAINALISNYTPWGISTDPLTLSLLGLTLTLSTVAVMREYQTLSPRAHEVQC